MKNNDYRFNFILWNKVGDEYRFIVTTGASNDKKTPRYDTNSRWNKMILPKLGCGKANFGKVYEHKDNDEATKIQRKFNDAFKLWYNAGNGSIVATSKHSYNEVYDYVNEIYQMLMNGVSNEKVFIKIGSDRFFEKPSYREDMLYVMMDPICNGTSAIYKIGTTNIHKTAAGRLSELKYSHYLSPSATVVTAYSAFNTENHEAFLHNHFHEQSTVSINRQVTTTYYKDYRMGCDETFLLNSSDLTYIDSFMKPFEQKYVISVTSATI